MTTSCSFESPLPGQSFATTAVRRPSVWLPGLLAASLLAMASPGIAAVSLSQSLSATDNTVDAPINTVDEGYGQAVAVSGNWMAVGSPGANDAAGSVAIYERVSGAWAWRQQLLAPSAQAGSGFGAAVDIYEAGGLVTVIVGAPEFDGAATDQGRAFVFSDTNAGAALAFSVATLNAPTPEANARFGTAVAVFADIAAVGAPGNGALENGLVLIRGRNSSGTNAWGPVGTTKTGNAGNRFGTSVDVHGEYVIVGAPMAENASNLRTGLAYVYRQDLGGANAFGLRHTLQPVTGQVDQGFGHSVGIWDSNIAVADSASRSIVGAPLRDDAALADVGSVLFFADATTAGVFVGTSPGGQAGYSVALEGAEAVAGRPGQVVGGQANAGQVNTYSFNGVGWATNTINLAESGANRNHQFGWSVDVSGTLAVIGTPGTRADAINAPPGAARAGSITALVKPGATWSVESKLLATFEQPFEQTDQFFGVASAIAGEWLAVGAPRDGQKGSDAGAIFMYRNVSGVWTPHSKLTALYGKAGDRFGNAVSLQGTRLVVGAPGADGFPVTISNAGAIYVYEFSGSVWAQSLESQSPNPTVDGAFGTSVSLHGDVLAVGAVGENGNVGRAYAYRDLVSLASPIALTVPASVGAGAGFSISVFDPAAGSANDESIAIGAYSDNGGGAGSGAAYVLSGASFGTVTALVNPAPGVNRFFGHSLAHFNGRVAVGAPTASPAPSGAVYVFSGVGYASVATLAPTGSPGQFGYALALDGTQLLVGSPASGGRAGLGHLFLRTGESWAQTDLLQPTAPAALDEFGTSVALSSGTFIVGAPLRDVAVSNDGALLVFQLQPEVLVDPLNLSLSEAGETTDTFGVSLNQTPAVNVTIQLSFDTNVLVDAGSGFGASPQTVTLMPANAVSGVTVTVRAVDDAIDQTSPHAALITTAATSSAQAAFNGLEVADVAVSIIDNDTAGISVIESGGATSVTEGGAGDSYILQLSSRPIADVTVNLSFDAAQIIVNGDTDGLTSVTITPADWDMPQSVVVVAVDDTLVETNPHAATIVQTISSADPNYAVIDPADVGVQITDNDLASIVLLGPSTSVAETAGNVALNARLQLVSNGTPGGTLSSPLGAQVVLTGGTATAVDDYSLSTLSVTFPAGTPHNATLPVDISIVNDRLLEGSESFVASLGAVTGIGTASGSNTVTITDDETGEFSFSLASDSTNESTGIYSRIARLSIAGSGVGTTFRIANPASVALNSTPGSAVAPADFALMTTVLNVSANAESPLDLSFEVGIVDDQIVEGSEGFTIGFGAITGTGALSATGTHTVTIEDNDSVSLGFVGGDTSFAESVGSVTREVGLSFSTVPAGGGSLGVDVTVPVTFTEGTATEPEDFTLTTSSVSFAIGATAASTQPVSVNIVDDAVAETSESFSLQLSSAGAPPYVGFGAASTTLTIVDNDTPGVTVTETDGVTAVAEGGASDNILVVLNSQPSGNVSIALTGTQVATAPDTLVFTPANWNVSQQMTVSAIDDAIDEDSPHAGSVAFAITSLDANYQGLAVPALAVSVQDNDTAGINLVQTDGTTAVTEGAGSDTYTIVLTSEPTADVTVVLTTGAQIQVSPGSLVFNASNWNSPSTLTVSAVDDNIVEGPQTAMIAHVVSTADPIYASQSIPTVSVDVTDNDSATVQFNPISVSQAEGTSPMAFTVTLTQPVQSGVILTVNTTPGTATAADFTAITNGTVSFAPNSAAAQTVNVSINADALNEDDEAFSIALSNLVATGAVSLPAATASATGTILDDDALPVLSITSPSLPEGDSGSAPMDFVVTLTPASGRAVSFTRATADGSATVADNDYVALGAQAVTIPAGQTSVTIPVTINGDAGFEGDETFSLNLTGISNATPGSLAGTGTILDDDQQPTTTEITSDAPDPSAVNAPYTVLVTVRGASTSPAGTITVDDGTGASCGPVALVAGTAPESTASCTLTSTTDGSKTLTAVFTPSSTAFGASSDTETHTVTPVANLRLSLSASPSSVASIGSVITYVATATNDGPSAAPALTITLPFPLGLGVNAATASAGGSCSGAPTVVCTWPGATAPGEARTATITAVVQVSGSRTLLVTATANSGATVTAATATAGVSIAAPIPVDDPRALFVLALAMLLLGGVAVRRMRPGMSG